MNNKEWLYLIWLTILAGVAGMILMQQYRLNEAKIKFMERSQIYLDLSK